MAIVTYGTVPKGEGLSECGYFDNSGACSRRTADDKTLLPLSRLVTNAIDEGEVSERLRLASDYYVPPHPLIALGVPYGLVLTFSAWLFPDNIPTFVPLGGLAKYLGLNFNLLMGVLSVFAAFTHVAEPIYALYLANSYGFTQTTTALWFLNGVGFGIFALWPLFFPDYFMRVQQDYCAVSPCL